jgi:subtilisin family serine protease
MVTGSLLLCGVCLMPLWAAGWAGQLLALSSPGLIPWLELTALAAGWCLAVLVGRILARRQGWSGLGSLWRILALAGGYTLITIAIRTVAGDDRWLEAGLRLGGLTPLTLAGGWWLLRSGGFSGLRWSRMVGINRPPLAALLLGAALAGLMTVGWPLSGALGDRLTSMGLLAQVLATALPEELLFRGIVPGFLLASHARRARLMVGLSWLTYLAFVPGQVLPTGNWDMLAWLVALAPLALLTLQLRLSTGSLWAGLAVAWMFRAMPRLFTDPRDEFLEPGQWLAWAGMLAAAAVFALLVWFARRRRSFRQLSPPAGRAPAGLFAMLAWAGWFGSWAWLGVPGFFDDGFIIVMRAQADLSAAYDIRDPAARRAYVYHALVQTAEQSQAPVRDRLQAAGLYFRPYYLQNMIRVEGHHWRQSEFAGLPGVATVMLNPNVRRYPVHTALGILPAPRSGPVEESAEWNVHSIGADAVWQLGYRGQGIAVGGQDTGYDWQHPALLSSYRGWNAGTGQADHNYNWHDAWGDSPVPVDDDGHGTHTMGIVLGDGGPGNHIGVAPAARWMGCRNMRRGIGNPTSYLECMEFFLAPYPLAGDAWRDGDVTRSPDVINNSWGCPDREGCRDDTLQEAVEALRAAGIMMVVSAGNDGPACQTAGEPPARYAAVFSVGAVNRAGDIAAFSSRGPIPGTDAQPPLLKPDLVAPGENVRSAVPGGGYGIASGTSMAGPHVAGAVALLWSARPELRGDIQATEDTLRQSATPVPVSTACLPLAAIPAQAGLINQLLGTLAANPPLCACGNVTGTPNNEYGWGRLDTLRAVHTLLQSMR